MTVERNIIKPGTADGDIAIWDHTGKHWGPGSPDDADKGDPGERFRWQQGDNRPSWDAGEMLNVRDFGAVGDGVVFGGVRVNMRQQ